jgi:hypothetical protein
MMAGFQGFQSYEMLSKIPMIEKMQEDINFYLKENESYTYEIVKRLCDME